MINLDNYSEAYKTEYERSIARGEERFASLCRVLLASEGIEAVKRVAFDEDYRKQMYLKYEID